MHTIASRRYERCYLRPRWKVVIVCCCLSRRSRYLPSALEGRQSHRDTPGRPEASLYFFLELRFDIRFLTRPFYNCLCASRRSRRPLPSEPEIGQVSRRRLSGLPHLMEGRRPRHPNLETSQGGVRQAAIGYCADFAWESCQCLICRTTGQIAHSTGMTHAKRKVSCEDCMFRTRQSR